MTTARILIVAGSDSGGGAGIQADVKTVTMLGAHAMTAITAITAQNTLAVQAVHPVPADMVAAQMRSCLDDIGVDAVKIGMIGAAATAHAVADVVQGLAPAVPIVFDPVMVASSGSVLADDDTVAAFDRLMRLATLVTPNVPELAALVGRPVDERDDRVAAARVLADRYGTSVLAKGGDAPGDQVMDTLVHPGGEVASWSALRVATRHSHGTGCTLASAIATALAQGMALPAAVERAIAFVRASLAAAPGLGAGHGPMGQQDATGFRCPA